MAKNEGNFKKEVKAVLNAVSMASGAHVLVPDVYVQAAGFMLAVFVQYLKHWLYSD